MPSTRRRDEVDGTRPRRWLAAALLVLGVCAFGGRSAAPASAATCSASSLRVAVVVDFGDGVTITSTCVAVPSGATGLRALQLRADALGTAAPRLNPDTFVCAIDGVPSTGCAESDPTAPYWSYWHGSGGSFTYSSVGSGQWHVEADVVEGWRYVPGGREGAAPPPAGSPDAATICTGDAPGTTAPVPTTSAPAPDGGSPAAPPPAGGAIGDAPVPPVAGSTGSTGSTAATTAASGGAPTSSPAPGAVGSDAPTAAQGTTAGGGATASSGSDRAAAPVVTISAHDAGSGGGSGWGALVGVGAVAGLGGAGALVARRRRLGP